MLYFKNLQEFCSKRVKEDIVKALYHMFMTPLVNFMLLGVFSVDNWKHWSSSATNGIPGKTVGERTENNKMGFWTELARFKNTFRLRCRFFDLEFVLFRCRSKMNKTREGCLFSLRFRVLLALRSGLWFRCFSSQLSVQAFIVVARRSAGGCARPLLARAPDL